jgi:hypothetical protein
LINDNRDSHRNSKEKLMIEHEKEFKKNNTFTPHLDYNSRAIAEKNSNLVIFI